MTEPRTSAGAVARARVRAVEQAHEGTPVTVATTSGDVSIESVTADGEAIEVTVNGPDGGDPLFRIFNPPTLVPDPNGDREINGVRFREDPIAAVALVIAENGGAYEKSKDRRRGRR